MYCRYCSFPCCRCRKRAAYRNGTPKTTSPCQKSRRIKGLIDENDTKISEAEQEIRELLRESYKPIIFCRFIATADYVAEELKKRLSKDFPRLHIISVTGALSEEERVLRVADLGESGQRVLVATDCLSEGINLQDRFNAVLHYDLPWNPNRLEQREGRVDRYGQKSKSVKAIILYGADNPVDGAVLNVLLRKARVIHKSLGIIVPLPQNSESIMDAIFHALFLRGGQKPQMNLFDNEAPIVKVHQDWDRASERQKKSRSLFAQHAIKPDEVAKELQEADNIYGSPEVVERFMRNACQRLGQPLQRVNGYWKLDAMGLPPSLQEKLSSIKSQTISFDQPKHEDVAFISRNHPFVTALSESFEQNCRK
ncbi:MAG: C-terminal helicase domain-containing protein [bacterium]